MKEGLLDIQELMPFFGYTDPRSFIKWCNTKKIPIIKLGLKKYVESHFLTEYIDIQLITFVEGVKPLKVSPKSLSEKNPPKKIKKYKPENEIVNKYLSRYETDAKPKTTL